jgi:hypothetical protein
MGFFVAPFVTLVGHWTEQEDSRKFPGMGEGDTEQQQKQRKVRESRAEAEEE